MESYKIQDLWKLYEIVILQPSKNPLREKKCVLEYKKIYHRNAMNKFFQNEFHISCYLLLWRAEWAE